MPFQKGHKPLYLKGWPGPHPPHVGYQKGHKPYYLGGCPGGNPDFKLRGEARPKSWGFQPGHPSFYRGGSVHGHAPTNTVYTPPTPEFPPSDPRSPLHGHRFGQPGVKKPEKNGMPATARPRECLEAVQNLKDLTDKKAVERLFQRFPPGLVRAMVRLQRSAEDASDGFFVQAQRLVREILIAPKRHAKPFEFPEGFEGVPRIELAHGSVDVELPGSGAPEEQEDAPRGAEDGRRVNENGHQKGNGSAS